MQILKRNTSGITLIETMVAVFILSLTGTLIVALTLQVVTITNSAKLRNQAVTFAERGLEASRSYYQTSGWLAMSSLGSASGTCYDVNGNWSNANCDDTCKDVASGGSPSVNDSSFHFGYIKLTTDVAAGKIEVKSGVNWHDRDACKNLNLITYYYNY